MYNPDRSLSFLLYDAGRLIRRDFERRIRALGLTRAQWAALAHLRRDEGCNQSTLADLIEVEPVTLARLLGRMERAGWIERRSDPRDRRARQVFLAANARPVIDQISELALQSGELALSGVAPENRERLIDMLIQVRATLLDAAPEANGRHGRRRTGTDGARRGSPAEPAVPTLVDVEAATRK